MNAFYGKKHKEESKRRGKRSLSYGRLLPPRIPIIFEKDERVVHFRTKWEYRVALYLEYKKIKWEYETKQFEIVYDYNGRKNEGTITFDFYLPELNVIIEVKGRWFPGSREKFDAGVLVSDIPVELWDQKKLKELHLT